MHGNWGRTETGDTTVYQVMQMLFIIFAGIPSVWWIDIELAVCYSFSCAGCVIWSTIDRVSRPLYIHS